MRELARSSQMMRRSVEIPAEAARPSRAEPRPSTERQRPTNPWVTTPPKTPEILDTPFDKIQATIRRRQLLVGAAVMIVILTVYLVATSGRQYVERPHPLTVADDQVRPLAIPVNVRMETVFSVLGTQAPRSVPDEPRLQRYSYGADLEVDAINGEVYAITYRVPNRAWRGIRVGQSEQHAQGALALLGSPQVVGDPIDLAPRTVGNYRVYPSLTERPRKTIGVEIRPPNGCFDVLVDVQPRVTGLLVDGDRRYAVVPDANPEWAVTEVRVVSRSIRGPFAIGVAC